MRAWLVVASLSLMTARSEACPRYDRTFVGGSYVDLRPEHVEHGPVVPNPRLFFHLAEGGKPGLPEFFSDDGSLIPATIDRVDQEQGVYQVDLEIDSGRIRVRHSPDDVDFTETFVISPTFTPSTRGVRVGEWSLGIDSDAVIFRLEKSGRREVSFNRGAVNFDPHESLRVTALYGDRREEVIFDYRPAGSIDDRPTDDRPARPIGPAVWAALIVMLATAVGIRLRSTTAKAV